MPQESQNRIVNIHIENDVVNNAPTLVYTDSYGEEWVHEQDGCGWSKLVKKSDSWYFKPLTP